MTFSDGVEWWKQGGKFHHRGTRERVNEVLQDVLALL